jgi:hypothetical protein
VLKKEVNKKKSYEEVGSGASLSIKAQSQFFLIDQEYDSTLFLKTSRACLI